MNDQQTDERRGEAKRIQFEFSPDALERLNKLKEKTDANSYAELVRNALRIYEWVIDQQDEGWEVALAKGDTVKTIKFFF